MKEKETISVSLEALCLLASFTVRETLSTLQKKGLITDTERDTILRRAVEGLHMNTIGLTQAETDHLLNILLGLPFTTPHRNLH